MTIRSGSAPPRPNDRSVTVPFVKLDGAGNDFVLIDERRNPIGRLSSARVRRWLDRHHGIGGDGLLVVRGGSVRPRAGQGETRAVTDEATRPARFQVDYWNNDGRPAAFCGNGARCVAGYLLGETGDTEETIGFVLGRVPVWARSVAGDRYAVLNPMPRPIRPHPPRPPGPRNVRGRWIDAGVPHWLLPVEDLGRFPLERWGPRLRRSPAFGPRGTNVDAVEVLGRTVHVRTWERGVEGETLACGSGLLAAAFWALQERGARSPVALRSQSGARFRARLDPGAGIWLEGPARRVFEGTIRLAG